MRSSTILINLAFMFGLLLILFAGGEIYYRFFYDSTDSFGLTLTTQQWFQKHYKINSAGVRDSIEYSAGKKIGRPRVTFLGDSFTAGHGIKNVEKRFANIIREARPLLDIQVLARNGFDTGAEIGFLKDFIGNGLELDRVVLVYCINDISDIVPEWQSILREIYQPAPFPLFVESSFFINQLYFLWVARSNRNVRAYYSFVERNYQGKVWEDQKKRLASLKELVRLKGGKLLVVTFPFLHALGSEYAYQSIHNSLGEFWKQQEVPHLDLLPYYHGYKGKDLVVGAYDAHPNEIAHGIAAHAIAEFLDKH